MARRSQELTGAAWGRLEAVWRLAEAGRLQIDEARAAIERSRRVPATRHAGIGQLAELPIHDRQAGVGAATIAR